MGLSNLDDVFRILDEARVFLSYEGGKRSVLTDVGMVKKSMQRRVLSTHPIEHLLDLFI